MFKEYKDKVKKNVKSFHEDERGDIVQWVLIILIAVVIIYFIYAYVLDKVFPQLKEYIDKILGKKPSL